VDDFLKPAGSNKKDFNVAFLNFLGEFEIATTARRKREIKIDAK